MKQIPVYLALIYVELFADIKLDKIAYQSEEFIIWLALFSLALISVLTLFISSEKIRRLKNKIAQEKTRNENIQKQHNTILSNMSENIHTIAEENVDVAKKLSQTDDFTSINEDIHLIENSENKLLCIASNLLEFLRLKSKKVEILNEKLSFSNLFNDVSGTLKEILKETPLELHYTLDKNVKENIYADTLNLSKILVNIILYCAENKAENILLNISNSNSLSKNNHLYFTFTTNLKKDANNSDTIFNANYNVNTGTYDSLGLFVARELSHLMGGELIANNDAKGDLRFAFDIEYKEVSKSDERIKIPRKKVLIVDISDNAALSCKNIFEKLQHDVTAIKAKEYLYKTPDFSDFDLIVLDEKLFTKSTISALKSSDTIVSVSNLFSSSDKNINSEYTNLSLQKPFTQKQIQELLENIYLRPQEEKNNADISILNKAPIYKNTFVDYKDVTLLKFSKFRETNILLVEDNFINQKVFLGILAKSGINITLANNGQEVLDILLENSKFDIIFMDINMPIMDGYTATKYIRENPNYNMIPIIALTALTSRTEIDSVFDVGMNAYLAKPLKKEKLFSALSMFIHNKKDERRKSVRYEERVVKLSGLNVGVGISNSSSNDFFYKEILKEFQDAYKDSDQLFSKLVEDFRYEQLRMLCLDIRGLSASIGAEDMSLLAAEVLKLLLFKKYDILRDFAPLYAKSLNRLNSSIEEYLYD
ncbi:MAG: response regulator [Helicobacteraceae bacterium]|nr:response regulator [Candidatus Sulfurimonas ponti]